MAHIVRASQFRMIFSHATNPMCTKAVSLRWNHPERMFREFWHVAHHYQRHVLPEDSSNPDALEAGCPVQPLEVTLWRNTVSHFMIEPQSIHVTQNALLTSECPNFGRDASIQVVLHRAFSLNVGLWDAFPNPSLPQGFHIMISWKSY